jgi:hypothetical protein
MLPLSVQWRILANTTLQGAPSVKFWKVHGYFHGHSMFHDAVHDLEAFLWVLVEGHDEGEKSKTLLESGSPQ